MHTFNITIRTGFERHQMTAIARCSVDLVDAAIDMFGPCAVTVVPA